jgi:hypothetical protein
MCWIATLGSYLKLIDSCITQFKAQGPSRTCNESKQEEEECFASRNTSTTCWTHENGLLLTPRQSPTDTKPVTRWHQASHLLTCWREQMLDRDPSRTAYGEKHIIKVCPTRPCSACGLACRGTPVCMQKHPRHNYITPNRSMMQSCLLLLYDSRVYSWVIKNPWAWNTSPPRNRFIFLQSSGSSRCARYASPPPPPVDGRI